jgi:ornithine carbamoyltransferase
MTGETAVIMSPPADVRSRRLLRVADLTAHELSDLLDAASQAKEPGRRQRVFSSHDLLVCLFDGRSTRTRAAFAGAAHRVGLEPLLLTTTDTHVGDGESLVDTLRVLSSSAAVIAVRLSSQTSIDEAASAVPIPVVNAGSAEHDPCHVLADLLTLREHFGSVSGLRIAYIGADRATPASLGEAGDLLGMEVIDAPPPTPVHNPDAYGREPEPDRNLVDPRDAVRGANVVYTDAWVQGSDQARRGGGIWDAATHQVTRELLALADEDVVVLHHMPIHCGQEIAADVVDDARSLIWRQAANRLPTTIAVLEHLLAGTDAP